MKNAETPVVKVVLYGAMSSLGSALMAEMLRRQHEVIAILDDLTALAPRPGEGNGACCVCKRPAMRLAPRGRLISRGPQPARRRPVPREPAAGRR